jgi:hypothetical protein
MQFEKAHLSQSNGIGACFFGQQGMPSGICMASSSAALVVMVADAAAAINGAVGPITTPTATPSAKNQRMTVLSFMDAKIPQMARIEKPHDTDFGASRRAVTSRPREYRRARYTVAINGKSCRAILVIQPVKSDSGSAAYAAFVYRYEASAWA